VHRLNPLSEVELRKLEMNDVISWCLSSAVTNHVLFVNDPAVLRLLQPLFFRCVIFELLTSTS